jgi:hypothetical protein
MLRLVTEARNNKRLVVAETQVRHPWPSVAGVIAAVGQVRRIERKKKALLF